MESGWQLHHSSGQNPHFKKPAAIGGPEKLGRRVLCLSECEGKITKTWHRQGDCSSVSKFLVCTIFDMCMNSFFTHRATLKHLEHVFE